ncbi:MAG: transcriptional regulator, PadR-like family [Clostridiales bacterium]|jgi:PadR family transcriptional regulator PadR|nr:transcriptional regulator, PadR-like family [Clostridiales bacterium]
MEKRSEGMAFAISSALLDALVLSIVSKEDAYGYKITQDIREAVDISESTLYPVLRRLQKSEYMTTYDREFAGRNRRYYRITPNGEQMLKQYLNDWVAYKFSIDMVLTGGESNE